MKSFKQYQKPLEERALHMMFKKIDIKIAKSTHKDLKDEQIIDKRHKFGDIITKKDINTYYSHMSEFNHNYREEIESYNKIVSRDEKEIRGN